MTPSDRDQRELASCYLCDKPFVCSGNGVYETTCEHDNGKRCAICGEGRVHHVGSAKACYGKNGTVYCEVTSME